VRIAGLPVHRDRVLVEGHQRQRMASTRLPQSSRQCTTDGKTTNLP
jgi:hypothetical protein